MLVSFFDDANGRVDAGTRMMREVECFKRWTARKAAPLAGVLGDMFWQGEWFDHWLRSPQEETRVRAYIRDNPVKAGLVRKPEEWPYLR
jgi:hypothetical protein